MAETTDQVKAEIVQTRAQLGATIDEIVNQVEATRRRIPFYGMQRRQLIMMAGGALAATAGLAFMAFYARNLHADHVIRNHVIRNHVVMRVRMFFRTRRRA